MDRKKYTIKNMKELAGKRGGKCLSKKYINYKTKLKWKCGECGNIWNATFNSVRNHWCPECGRKQARKNNRRYHIDDLKKYAQSKNGLCLSEKYTNCDHQYDWKRNKCETEWEASWSQIKIGSWCPYCAGKKYDIKDMKKIAEERDGECLSEEYLGVNFKLKWKCNICGHIWENSPGHIINGNQWCVKCAKERIAQELRGFSIEDMREIAKNKNGECLSKEYVNAHTKLKWKCNICNHIWSAIWNSIQRESWCPQCASGKPKNKFREVIEEILCARFPKVKPKWLLNDNGNRLELDGYNRILKVAFEYQGKQHFQSINHFGGKKALTKRQKYDQIKKQICKKRGIILLCPDYKMDEEEFADYIRDELSI